jgi:hypothetical protein
MALYVEFGIPVKLVRLIEICLNLVDSEVSIGKHFAYAFPIQNGLKKGDG